MCKQPCKEWNYTHHEYYIINILIWYLNKKIIKDVSHNLNVLEDGQGGLLDIFYKDNIIFVSYSENRSNGKSSTSVARANLNKEKLNFT